MSASQGSAGAMMGLCVGQRCIGAAIAREDWDGCWSRVQARHEEAFPQGAGYVRRVDCGLRAATEIVGWARSHRVTHAWLEAPEEESGIISHIELASVLVAELFRADVVVIAAGPPEDIGTTPEEIRWRLVQRGAADGACLAEYVAMAMIVAGQRWREARAQQLTAARGSMPSSITQVLKEIAR